MTTDTDTTPESDVSDGKDYQRDTNYVTTRITRDGRDGYPVVAGRYRLVAARACPWANRAVIVRRLPERSAVVPGPLTPAFVRRVGSASRRVMP